MMNEICDKNRVFCFMLYLAILSSFNAFAGVQLRNGNFFVTYTDIYSTSSGAVLDVARTYNSKAIYDGYFGYGWGTPFEVKLETSSDGSIIVTENGSGATNRFRSRSIDDKALTKLIDAIVAAVKKNKVLTSQTEATLRKALLTNNLYRNQISKKYNVLLDNFKVGDKLISDDFPGQEIIVTSEGFQRNIPNGITQYFDKTGKILKTKSVNGYGLNFEYNKAQQMVKLSDTAGNQLLFQWTSNNKIKSIQSQDKKIATYEYSKSGNDLIKMVDMDGVKYSYNYDDRHNLIQIADLSIKDPLKQSIYIKYDPKTLNTLEVTNRDGSKNTYYYEFNPQRPKQETTTTVVRKEASGEVFAEQYFYDYRLRNDGSEWLAHYVAITDGKFDSVTKKFTGGNKEEAIYGEKNSYPLKKISGDQVTEFSYNTDGLMSKKVVKFKDKIVENNNYTYHPSLKKLTEVTTLDNVTKYEYNPKGELVKAYDKKGRSLLFVYDASGKISKMYEKNPDHSASRSLAFTYNTKGKPLIVNLEGVGTLNVTYDDQTQTEVNDVKSSKGLAVYNEVRSVFSSFMEVISPTGISLDI